MLGFNRESFIMYMYINHVMSILFSQGLLNLHSWSSLKEDTAILSRDNDTLEILSKLMEPGNLTADKCGVCCLPGKTGVWLLAQLRELIHTQDIGMVHGSMLFGRASLYQ